MPYEFRSNSESISHQKSFVCFLLVSFIFILYCLCLPIVVHDLEPFAGVFRSPREFCYLEEVSMRTFCVVTLLGCIFLLSSPTLGQGNLGAITGTVQDPRGTSVPDAALT